MSIRDIVNRNFDDEKPNIKYKKLPKMNQHFISSDDAKEFQLTSFYLQRAELQVSTVNRKLNVTIPTKSMWDDFVMSYIGKEGFTVQMTGTNSGYIIKGTELMLFFSKNYDGNQIRVLGDQDEVDMMCVEVLSRFDEVRCTIDWYYSPDGDQTKIPLSNEQLPIQEMYPWMEESLDEYYSRFMRSKASILLLIGPPGTGKTTWIKGLLHNTSSNAMVTYDPAILAKDYVFAEFISGETNVMIIEDADNFLRSREDGNALMHKFLNIGSGLVSNPNKKLIFSTNLPNVNDIDEALLRPGRCHDVLEFRKLTSQESIKLAKAIGVDNIDSSMYNESATIAEVFNNAKPKKAKTSIGFM
jgi:hypothetical protein